MVEVTGKEVVVVTRGGCGDWFLFDTFEAADRHPLIQFGDIICVGIENIQKCWNIVFFPGFLEQVCSPIERSNILIEIGKAGKANWTKVLDRHRLFLWKRMVEKCQPLPTDPATICNLITRDRILSLKETRPMAKEPKNTEATENTENAAATENADANSAAATTAEGEKGTTKRAPPVREPKYKPSSIITLLADKDGNPFGPENNPKREGSKAGDRFKLYRNGMTVEAAIAAGLTRADIDFDVQKKFIAVTEASAE